MKFRFLVCVSLGFWAACLSAAPVRLEAPLTVGSTTYSNVTVLGYNATDIYFTHDHGISNVKLKYLPSDLQTRFHYDPKAAEEAERKIERDNSMYQTSVAASIAAQASRTNSAEPVTSEDSLADPISPRSLLGKSGPALEVEKWLGPKPALEGKAVLLWFWAPWSAPCRKAIPELNALQKKFAAKLTVVAVSSASEAQLVDQAGAALECASAVDSKAKLSSTAGVTSVPCALLMDAKGIVRYQGHPAALTDQALQTLLGKLDQ